MRKNVNMNRVNKAKLYRSIMESVTPEIRKAIKEAEKQTNTDESVDEEVLNELFGFGSSMKKPEKALSLENTDDENAELVIQWCAYFMSQANNNVKKGLEAFFKSCGNVITKAPMIITKGILKLLSKAIKLSVNTPVLIASTILASISALVRLVNSGVESAQSALSQLYKTINSGITQFYTKFTSKTEEMVTSSTDTLNIWLGAISGALMACANKIQGAAEAFNKILSQIAEDAKEKKNGAVLIVKTWLQAKSEEVQKWVKDTAGDIRKTVSEAWNSLDKKVRKSYNKAAEKLEGWMNNISDLIDSTKEKISDAAESAKDFAIDKKDKALIWGIQKGVKGLSDKYSEEQVVALVRKCYNESMLRPVNNKFVINEKYFYNSNTRKRMALNESRRRRMIK